MMIGPGRAYDTFIKTTINPKILFFQPCELYVFIFAWLAISILGAVLEKIANQSLRSYIAFKLASQPIHFHVALI